MGRYSGVHHSPQWHFWPTQHRPEGTTKIHAWCAVRKTDPSCCLGKKEKLGIIMFPLCSARRACPACDIRPCRSSPRRCVAFKIWTNRQGNAVTGHSARAFRAGTRFVENALITGPRCFGDWTASSRGFVNIIRCPIQQGRPWANKGENLWQRMSRRDQGLALLHCAQQVLRSSGSTSRVHSGTVLTPRGFIPVWSHSAHWSGQTGRVHIPLLGWLLVDARKVWRRFIPSV